MLTPRPSYASVQDRRPRPTWEVLYFNITGPFCVVLHVLWHFLSLAPGYFGRRPTALGTLCPISPPDFMTHVPAWRPRALPGGNLGIVLKGLRKHEMCRKMKLYCLVLLQEQYLPFLSTFYVTLRSILQFIVIFSLCLPLPSLSCSLALSGKLFSAHHNTEKKPTSRKPHQTLPMGHLFIVLLEREDTRWGASSSAGHFEGRSPSRIC